MKLFLKTLTFVKKKLFAAAVLGKILSNRPPIPVVKVGP